MSGERLPEQSGGLPARVVPDVTGLVRATARLEPGEPLPPETPLREIGMTSIALVELLDRVEDHFRVQFPDAMLTEETFFSVASLSTALSSLLAQGSP